MAEVFKKLSSGFKKTVDFIRRAIVFVTGDIWHVRGEEQGLGHRMSELLRILILASRGFNGNKLVVIASALTYFTLLAFVPFVSIILGIAKAFNAQDYIQNELFAHFTGHTEVLNFVFDLVDRVLSTATNGVVVGIGLVFIFWSLWAIVNNMERAFNIIWEIPKGRKFYRKITDLFASILILPLLLILTSGLSIYIRTAVSSANWLQALSPFVHFLVKLAPFFVSFLLFTLMYIIVPNTKVRFKNASIAGLLAGFGFQIFQYIFISGQLWVNRYNAIYGSFAAIPILLLWLQTTWIIILFGAEITFASQNVRNFYFEKEVLDISHRYRYFLVMLIMSVICDRFEKGEKPLSANERSVQHHIPARLTNRILNRLLDVKLISETRDEESRGEVLYQPALDIHQITTGLVFEKYFEIGSDEKEFEIAIDTKDMYARQWNSLLAMERAMREKGDQILVKDLID